MSFLCTTPKSTPDAPDVRVQEADPFTKEAYQRIVRSADVIAARPYQTYGGQRLAGLTPDTLAAFDATRRASVAGQRALGSAEDVARRSAMTMPERDMTAYMNPYVQNVVDIAKREALRGDKIAEQGRNYAASQAGAFGGSRHAILEAEANRNLGQRLDDIQTSGLASAFDKGLSAMQADQLAQARAAGVLGDIGTRQSATGLAGAQALDAIGTRQQQQQQAGLDIAYDDFTRQRDWDKGQLDWLSNITNRVPQGAVQQTQTGTRFTPQASPISQLAGLGTAGVGVYGLGKWGGLWAEGGEIKRFAEGGPSFATRTARALRDFSPAQLGGLLNPRIRQLLGLSEAQAAALTPAQVQAIEAEYIAPNEEEDLPRATGTSNISAIPPQFTTEAPAAPPEPAPQRGLTMPTMPATPSLPRITAPDFSDMPDAAAEYRRMIGGMETAEGARARAREAAPKPELSKDPMEGLPRWVMPVLQAGLGMMQAKPGQSALAGIGAGVQAGVGQAAQDRKERLELERENQRRRERAEDVAERRGEAAAGDTRAQRAEAATVAQLTQGNAANLLARKRAELDAQVANGNLSVQQANLELNKFTAQLQAARLGLEERRQNSLDAYYAAQGMERGTDENGNLIFVDKVTGRTVKPDRAIKSGQRTTDMQYLVQQGFSPEQAAAVLGKRSQAERMTALAVQMFGKSLDSLTATEQQTIQQLERTLSRFGAPQAGGTIGGGLPPLNLPPK